MKRISLLSLFAVLLLPIVAHADSPILIKSPDASAVYLVQNGIRHAFPLQKIYESWYGTTFENVQTVSVDALASYPLGQNVKFKSGSLVKIQTDPKVYLVADDAGGLQWIKTGEDFLARGFHFSDVRDIPDAFFPDYTILPDAQNFATPEQGGTATTTPVVITPPPTPAPTSTPAAIQSVVSSAVRNDTRSGISYTITSTSAAPLTLSYQVLGSATSTKIFAATSTFTGTIDAGLAEIVPYHLMLGTGTDVVTQDGTFLGYRDFTIGRADAFAPTNASLLQAALRLGAFQITNNSASTRSITQVTLQFDSNNFATDDITKTLEIKRLNADGTVNEALGEHIIGSNTSMLGAAHVQNFALDETFAPGETKFYEVAGGLFNNMNKDKYNSTDSLTVQFESYASPGDVITIYTNRTIGSLLYQ